MACVNVVVADTDEEAEIFVHEHEIIYAERNPKYPKTVAAASKKYGWTLEFP